MTEPITVEVDLEPEPEYFGYQADPILDPGTESAHSVLGALALTRSKLDELREHRKQVNQRIKALVAQEVHLQRMARIAEEMLKGGGGDGDDAQPELLDD